MFSSLPSKNETPIWGHANEQLSEKTHHFLLYFKQPKNKVQINYDQKHYHLSWPFTFRGKKGKNDNYSNCKTNHFANGQLQGKLFTF